MTQSTALTTTTQQPSPGALAFLHDGAALDHKYRIAGEPSDEELKTAYHKGFEEASMCGAEASWLAGLRAVSRCDRSAALAAAPEGEVPSDDEMAQFLFDNFRGPIEFICDAEEEAHAMIRNHIKFARAALNRWGRPATPHAPLEGEVVAATQRLEALAAFMEPGSEDRWAVENAATLLQQLSAAAPAVVPWSDEPTVTGRYLCLREGSYTLHDVDFYRDLQMGITGQWEATEVCSDLRHGCPVANLQPASWLLVDAIPLPAPQGGEVE